MVELPDIRRALAQGAAPAAGVGPAAPGLAAVALVLAGASDDLHLCFIRRAEHPRDRWSGDMALPGGRACERDRDAWSVAVRETAEEVGLVLAPAHRCGRLPDMPVSSRPEHDFGLLCSFVCYLGESLPALRPEAGEVAAAYWIGLSHLWDEANLTEVEWNATRYSGIAWRDQVIWGLTRRVLDLFADTLGRPLPTLAG